MAYKMQITLMVDLQFSGSVHGEFLLCHEYLIAMIHNKCSFKSMFIINYQFILPKTLKYCRVSNEIEP